MSVKNSKKRLSELTVEELNVSIESLRRDLFTVRLNAATTHVKDYSQFKKLKGDIARGLTFLQQKTNTNSVS